ncbi:hypothetical protein QBC39DRAFT_181927 [Podospora conica]|nr:hypothetical protein QBC39DRAFT_181927 [Schizothecium conicum]
MRHSDSSLIIVRLCDSLQKTPAVDPQPEKKEDLQGPRQNPAQPWEAISVISSPTGLISPQPTLPLFKDSAKRKSRVPFPEISSPEFDLPSLMTATRWDKQTGHRGDTLTLKRPQPPQEDDARTALRAFFFCLAAPGEALKKRSCCATPDAGRQSKGGSASLPSPPGPGAWGHDPLSRREGVGVRTKTPETETHTHRSRAMRRRPLGFRIPPLPRQSGLGA